MKPQPELYSLQQRDILAKRSASVKGIFLRNPSFLFFLQLLVSRFKAIRSEGSVKDDSDENSSFCTIVSLSNTCLY